MRLAKKPIDVEACFPVGRFVENTAKTGIHRGKVGVVEGHTPSKKSVRVILSGETHSRTFLPQHLRTTGRRPVPAAAQAPEPATSPSPRESRSPRRSDRPKYVFDSQRDRQPSPLGRVFPERIQNVAEIMQTMDYAELVQVHRLLGETMATFIVSDDVTASTEGWPSGRSESSM